MGQVDFQCLESVSSQCLRTVWPQWASRTSSNNPIGLVRLTRVKLSRTLDQAALIRLDWVLQIRIQGLLIHSTCRISIRQGWLIPRLLTISFKRSIMKRMTTSKMKEWIFQKEARLKKERKELRFLLVCSVPKTALLARCTLQTLGNHSSSKTLSTLGTIQSFHFSLLLDNSSPYLRRRRRDLKMQI
jgi:hypothetical protein